MERYEILEHTGDVKIRVFGETPDGLFQNALLAMNEILKPKIKGQRSKVRNIEITSTDLNALLVDFLSEINYLRQVNREVYDKVKFTKFSAVKVEAELNGRKVEEFGEDIKAVTFHELDVRQGPEGIWETVIVFDV